MFEHRMRQVDKQLERVIKAACKQCVMISRFAAMLELQCYQLGRMLLVAHETLGGPSPSNNGGDELWRAGWTSWSGGSNRQIPVTYPMGQGEPVNAIISGNSDSAVLVDSELNGGLRNYYVSLGFSSECLGQKSGSNQAVNLGDGHGYCEQCGLEVFGAFLMTFINVQ
ncbi:hypothetical protein H0H81_010837 [Sphagnurus paluster]|uniref:Uncharacterized protein n=1 Tax=Sphagnurus paluster TaxID=117069 RepID=A0A9P7GQW5_9AGAR|nr:hypothetical protein H0H81_010837 [Sphagnurus paluster]